MLRITIDHKRQCIRTADGLFMTVFPASVRIEGRSIPLQDCRGIMESGVEIVFKRWIFRRRFNLTAEVSEGITEFLGDYSIRRDHFDCYAFVNMVFNVSPHRANYMLRFWNTAPLITHPDVGNVIFLLTEETQTFHHAAIHLGYGIYISVYGFNGDIEFATLADMKRDYGAADVVLATPRPQRLPIL